MSDFDDDFDNFDDENFDDFNENKSLKDTWSNNPMLKIFTVIAGIVLVVAAVMIFSGGGEDQESKTGIGIDERDTLGGEVSQNYSEVIDEVNEQRLENAVRTGTSTIPMLVNTEEQELLSESEDLPAYQEFDPLATFRAAVAPDAQEESPEIVEQEPTLVPTEQVFTPQATQQMQQPQAPTPNPEAVQALAEAMSEAAGNIIKGHQPMEPRITQVTPEDYYETLYAENMNDMANNTGTDIDSLLGNSDSINDGDEIIQTILIPAGTINYGQILIEANSDVPGPVLAQLMSGPLAGARLIGDFTTQNKLIVLRFNSIVVDGVNQPVSAVAIDPNTTLPGVATDVNNRYWQRVVLPAAARFLEGVGSAIAQDTETTVTVSGDTVIQEQSALDFEQELGRGVEEGFSEIADFMDDEADDVQPLIRVQRGTPIGVFFTEPVIEVE